MGCDIREGEWGVHLGSMGEWRGKAHTDLGAILGVFLERPAVEGREGFGADGGSKGDGDEERRRQSCQEALVEYGRERCLGLFRRL